MKSLPDIITERAAADLFPVLMKSSTLSVDHRSALLDVLKTYSDLALMGDSGCRARAFPLAMGVGKTQSIASWCKVINEMGLDHISVLICGEQLRDLDDLRRQLIEDRGIPAERIGFVHSSPKEQPDLAPATHIDDAADYQYLLVSHEHVRQSKDIDRVNRYGGHERSLCVWDESLVRNDGSSLSLNDFKAALGAIGALIEGPGVNPDADLTTVKKALGYCRRALRSMEEIQQAHTDRLAPLEGLPAETRSEWSSALEKWANRKEDAKSLSKFISMATERLRYNQISGTGDSGVGVISYEVRVPTSLKRMVILDASALVRELSQLDRHIEVADEWSRVRTFENVNVTQHTEWATGIDPLKRLRKDSPLLKRVVDDIMSVPADEAVLICTRKSGNDGRKVVLKIQRALEAAGANLNAQVEVRTSSKEDAAFGMKYNFITWGQHKATSKYSFCKHVFAVGILRRDQLEISSAMAAQLEDVDHPMVSNHTDVLRVLASEQFYCLQQLVGRGPARESVMGHAKEAHIHVYCRQHFPDDLIQKGLPDVKWSMVTPSKAPKKGTKTGDLTEKLTEHLMGLPMDIEKLSCRALKAEFAPDVGQRIFQNARTAALSETDEWTLSGQSLVRTCT